MKIEDDITKDFKNKIYRKLNVLKNDNENNASKEMIKEQSDLLFFGEKNFINFSKKNSGLMSELFSKINENLNKNKKSDYNNNDDNLNFNVSQSHYDRYDLQDFIKKKEIELMVMSIII